MSATRSFSGEEVRRLVRQARTGTLATINRDGGIPYASLVNVAADVDGRPLILVSRLAWHTRNLQADTRASLLVASLPCTGDALTGARVTVMGRFVEAGGARLRRRYLARHPEAAMYVDFPDFGLRLMEAETVHAVAGFGRIETLPASEVFPPSTAILEVEESALQHMNQDHLDAIQRYAASISGEHEGEWRMAAIDPDGCDLTDGSRSLRVAFPAPVSDAEDLRAAFVALSSKYPR